MAAQQMQCSPCGLITSDTRAVTCCKGYCYDASGESCNAWPCPNCGALHSWTGSINVERAKRAVENMIAEEKRLAAKLGYRSITAD